MNTRIMIPALLAALMLFSTAGCNDDNESDDSEDNDKGASDSDTDTDTDTDSDTDSDTDGDSDTDSDADDIWEPGPGTTWQWQLTGTIDTSVDVEMYDVDVWRTSAQLLDELHGSGKHGGVPAQSSDSAPDAAAGKDNLEDLDTLLAGTSTPTAPVPSPEVPAVKSTRAPAAVTEKAKSSKDAARTRGGCL